MTDALGGMFERMLSSTRANKEAVGSSFRASRKRGKKDEQAAGGSEVQFHPLQVMWIASFMYAPHAMLPAPLNLQDLFGLYRCMSSVRCRKDRWQGDILGLRDGRHMY